MFVILFSRCEREKSTQTTPIPANPLAISAAFAREIAAYNYSFTASTKVGKNTANARTNVVTPSVESVETLTADGYDVVHVINYKNDKGWAIISADRRIVPVLAYSSSGTFDLQTKEAGLSDWLNIVKEEVKRARNKLKEADPTVDRLWVRYEKTLNANGRMTSGCESSICNQQIKQCPTNYTFSTGRMITDPNGSYPGAQWNQDNGYAYYSQFGTCTSCGRQLAGCGPIALAQYLRYYSKQIATKPTVNYSAMTQTINNACNSMIYGEDQIATLIGYCGDITNATYSSSPCGTSIYDSDLTHALSTAGCASTGTEVSLYSNLSNVQYELTGYHPLFITGSKSGSSTGHLWLMDGYTENHYYDLDCCQANGYGNCVESGSVYYSLNWGWGIFGGNGWYTLHNFSGANGLYDSGMKVWIGTRP